ncbi:MAG: inositol monophosphatase, partial [Firmicutes bacterium]|nr:inositol monophosphatase [Bacillota bacterium]
MTNDWKHQVSAELGSLAEAAARYAKSGGELLMNYFRAELQVTEKSAGNLVSEADLESEKLIVSQIRHDYPSDDILSEEDENHAAQQSSPSLWIIDPLDGTNNFANGLAHFATSVAYYREGIAQCGAIYDPIRDELFLAVRGGGAYRNGHRLHVSAADALNKCLIATGFYYDRGEIMRRTLRTIEAF